MVEKAQVVGMRPVAFRGRLTCVVLRWRVTRPIQVRDKYFFLLLFKTIKDFEMGNNNLTLKQAYLFVEATASRMP